MKRGDVEHADGVSLRVLNVLKGRMIDYDHSLASVVVPRSAHLAGTVATTEDVMMVGEHASVQIEEKTRVLVVPDSVYHFLSSSVGDAVKR